MLKKRILIFIVCVAAVSGLLALSALADNGDVALDKIEFSFTAPRNGWLYNAEPGIIYNDYDGFDLEYMNEWEHKFTDGIDEGFYPMDYDEEFENGGTYYVEMSVVPRKGFVIDGNTQVVAVSDTGRAAEVVFDPSTGSIVLGYTVGPGISSHPVDAYAEIGEKVRFSIETDDAENVASYQWQISKNNGASWGNSSSKGYNTKTLTVTVASKHDGWLYRCVVTDVFGDTAVSRPAKLTLRKVISRLELTTSDMVIGNPISDVVLVDGQGNELDDDSIEALYHCNIEYWMENYSQRRYFEDGQTYYFVLSANVDWTYDQMQNLVSEYYFKSPINPTPQTCLRCTSTGYSVRYRNGMRLRYTPNVGLKCITRR